MSYSKLHSSLVNSSLWAQPDSVRILFVTMLAICDKHGYVFGSKQGIGRIANIEIGDIDYAFSTLMLPDDDSSDLLRNPENQGKRIERIDGGWRLLNFEYYTQLRNADDRREQNRVSQAKFRESKKLTPVIKRHQPSPNVIAREPSKPISDVDVDADKNISEEKGEAGDLKARPRSQAEVEAFCLSISLPISDGTYFWNTQEAGGWTRNGKRIKDWKASIRAWKAGKYMPSQKAKSRADSLGTYVPLDPSEVYKDE